MDDFFFALSLPSISLPLKKGGLLCDFLGGGFASFCYKYFGKGIFFHKFFVLRNRQKIIYI
jgi:hypothetical protein